MGSEHSPLEESSGDISKPAREFIPTREAAAYHEAGHAIVTFANGLGVSSIGIGTDNEGRPLGWCDQQYATVYGMGVQFGAIAAAQALAGVVAERIYSGEPDIAHKPNVIIELVRSASLDTHCHWGQDAQNANLIAYGAVSENIDEMPPVIVGAWRHADTELQSLWPGVEALATSLLEKNELSRDEIKGKVNAVLPRFVK